MWTRSASLNRLKGLAALNNVCDGMGAPSNIRSGATALYKKCSVPNFGTFWSQLLGVACGSFLLKLESQDYDMEFRLSDYIQNKQYGRYALRYKLVIIEVALARAVYFTDQTSPYVTKLIGWNPKDIIVALNTNDGSPPWFD